LEHEVMGLPKAIRPFVTGGRSATAWLSMAGIKASVQGKSLRKILQPT
jgi:hypothetical protein